MRRRQTNITDLPTDVLKHIMKMVARPPDGAANFARAMLTNKEFMELSKDGDLLRAVDFSSSVVQPDTDETFWLKNGLLAKCARAGNDLAGLLLYLHVRYLVDSADVNMINSSIAKQDIMERIRVSKTQACTRSMKRGINAAVQELKALLRVVNRDLKAAEELRLSML